MKGLLFSVFALAVTALACEVIQARFPVLPSAPPTPAHVPHVDWLAYSDPAGFSIQHPPTWQQLDSEGYPVVFVLPAAAGTNLIEKRMEIEVRSALEECRQSTYGAEAPVESTTSINGVDFLMQTGSGIAAGNIYDWTSYSTATEQHCVTITFVLHSSSSGVYATEPPAFDRAAESAIFSELIGTSRWDG